MNKDVEWLKLAARNFGDTAGSYIRDVRVVSIRTLEILIKQTDGLAQPEVPQFIADIITQAGTNIERNKEYVIRSTIAQFYANDFEANVWEWFNTKGNLMVFIRAVENGYETKKEAFYFIQEPITGQFLIRDKDLCNGVKWVDGFSTEPEYFTEKLIKSIDDRYWSFATEVKR